LCASLACTHLRAAAPRASIADLSDMSMSSSPFPQIRHHPFQNLGPICQLEAQDAGAKPDRVTPASQTRTSLLSSHISASFPECAPSKRNAASVPLKGQQRCSVEGFA
jgi:hypothetical protein